MTNKLRTNIAIIIPPNKSHTIVLSYTNDIYDKTLEFINNNNNNIQLQYIIYT